MAYMVVGPETEGRNFSDYMVVIEEEWAAYVAKEMSEYTFLGPYATEAEAEEIRDRLNGGEIEFKPDGKAEYFDTRYPDDDDDELFPDPGNFDGGYGAGSYYEHAMRKDD